MTRFQTAFGNGQGSTSSLRENGKYKLKTDEFSRETLEHIEDYSDEPLPKRRLTMRTIRTLYVVLSFALICGRAAFAEPSLSLGTVAMMPGGTGTLPLSLSGGTDPFAGSNAKIILPAKVHCEGVTAGPALSDTFTVDHRMVTGTQDVVTILAYSGTNTFTGGEVLQLFVAKRCG